jgi:dihydroorotate dehydrogenase (NAD+) catalytic subunit
VARLDAVDVTDDPSITSVDLSVSMGRLRLTNPVITASGTCGYGLEYAPYMDMSQLGAFTTKSVTVHERKGNDPPRVAEVGNSMLNAIGLANVGLERFVAEKVPELPKLRCPVLVNVAGHKIDDYVTVCARLDPLKAIHGLELNVSCPNVADGLEFGTDPKRLACLLSEVRSVVKDSLLIVKLSPNVTDIVSMARAAIDAGTDALSMINTISGMSIDIETSRSRLGFRHGGLSGPAIKPVAIRMIDQVYRGVAREANIPIIGMGGIMNWRDAAEYFLAGASAVAVGTILFVDPATPIRIQDGIRSFLARKGIPSIRELVGAVRNS